MDVKVKVNLGVSNVAQHVQCTCAIPQSLTNVAPYLGKKKSLQGEGRKGNYWRNQELLLSFEALTPQSQCLFHTAFLKWKTLLEAKAGFHMLLL